jgi:hypothetical protein
MCMPSLLPNLCFYQSAYVCTYRESSRVRVPKRSNMSTARMPQTRADSAPAFQIMNLTIKNFENNSVQNNTPAFPAHALFCPSVEHPWPAPSQPVPCEGGAPDRLSGRGLAWKPMLTSQQGHWSCGFRSG